MLKSYLPLASGVALAALMSPTASFAQVSEPQAAPDDGANAGQLSEIVVTAQRRAQNLQDVPISVTAFSADTLAERGVSNVSGLANVDPSVKIGGSTGVVFPFLRGIGNPSASTLGNESSVPVYIDDVYYTRLSTALLDLGNIERMEVLKGPQGTLFGRNASGGAIQIFTRDPSRGPAFEMNLGAANYETYTGRLYVAQPLGEDAGIDLAVAGQHMEDGWGTNLFLNEPNNRYNYASFRSKLVFKPTETTAVRLIGFYVRSYTQQGNYNRRYPGTFGGTAPIYGARAVSPPGGYYDSEATVDSYQRTQNWGGSVKIDQELGFADFSSITAYRKIKETNIQDGEELPQNFQLYDLGPRDRQISQEIQLKSRAGSNINWILGAFYLNSKQGFLPIIVTGDSLGVPGAEFELSGLQTIKSYATFGQATVPLSDATQITLGARYTWDKVHGETPGTFFSIPAANVRLQLAPARELDESFKKFTYRAAIDHDLAERVKVYASISRGYKSGTFNTLPLSTAASRPETVDAYELGLKSELFDRRVRLNAAAFWNDIGNPQVQVAVRDPITGVSSIGLANAEKARTRGFEANSEFVAAEGLTFRAGATYTDAKYRDFKNAPFNYPIVNGTCVNAATPADPTGSGPAGAAGYLAGLCIPIPGDASGNRMVQVPKWRFVGGINYDVEAGFGRLNFDVNANYTSSVYWNPDNFLKQSSYTLVNAAVILEPSSLEGFSIRLWANNITKEKYISNELPVALGAGHIAAPAAPRTYGVEVGFKF